MDDALLSLLPTLVTLVEEAGVVRAAKRLGISQPRMSARLATLRTILADPVLVSASGRRGLIATDRAKGLADVARRTLNDLEAAIADNVFDSMAARRTFTIMANDNAAAIVGLRLVEAVRAASGPGVRMALLQFDPERIGELETGRIDLVLAAPSQLDRMPALIARAIVHDCFLSAVRAGGRIAPALDDYCARDHVLVSGDGGGFGGLVDRALAEQGRTRRVALSVQSYLLAIEAVASGDLVATLPSALLRGRERGLALFDPPLDLPPFSLSAAWHARADHEPAHRWLRGRLDCACRHALVDRQRDGICL